MNEITVKINCSIEEIKELLEDKGFKIINKYLVDDTYYIAKDVKIDKASIKTILSDYILIRDIQQYDKELINRHKIVKITYKHKNIAPNGEIVNQEKYDCEIENILDGHTLLTAIGYKRLMNIKEKAIEYSNNDITLIVKDVENSEKLIELEIDDKNPSLNTIDKLKQKINELNIPIDKSNFFVKKAEIELKKVLEIYND